VRRLYYILFYCAVFALAWTLDPPLIVRADYLRTHGPPPLRFQSVPAESTSAHTLPKEVLSSPAYEGSDPGSLPTIFPAGWPAESETITVKSPAPLKATAEQPFQFTPLPLPHPGETLTPQMLVPFFQTKIEKRGTNPVASLTFNPPQPESKAIHNAVRTTP
jgi:hypothetical protein